MALERFFVTNVVKPDGERQYEKFKELHFRQYADIAEAKLRQQTELIYAQTQAQKVIIDSQAQATKRAQEGYTYALIAAEDYDVAYAILEKIGKEETITANKHDRAVALIDSGNFIPHTSFCGKLGTWKQSTQTNTTEP